MMGCARGSENWIWKRVSTASARSGGWGIRFRYRWGWIGHQGGVAVGTAGLGEVDDDGEGGDDEEGEDASFGSGGSAAEDGLADGVGGEKTGSEVGPAVSYAVEEGLPVVPGEVEADGPP